MRASEGASAEGTIHAISTHVMQSATSEESTALQHLPCCAALAVTAAPASTLSVIIVTMKTRDEALEILHDYTKTDSLRKHALAVEQAMRACAAKYAGDPDRWGMAGLLHDFDYEKYPTAEQHPWEGSKILETAGFDAEFRNAILSHASYTGVPRDTVMARALFACDELCGFLTACALVQPNKSLAEVKVPSVRKKMKDKAFARSVNRGDIVAGALELGVELDEHIAFVLGALCEIAPELGLAGNHS